TAGQNVKVSYTDPTAGNDFNAIQDLAGNDAATLPSTIVSNGSIVPSLDTTPPIFVSAAVGASGTQLTLAYNEALDAVNLPPLGSFNVNVGGQLVAVTGVTISGTNVILTLATPVTTGQNVKVSYTDPSTGNDVNAIQDHAGNDAVTLPVTTVTNGSTLPSLDITPPTFVSGVVGATGTQLTLTYNEALDSGNLPTVGSFAVNVAGQLVTVTAVSISGTNVILTLGTAITLGQAVTLGYTDPTVGNDPNAIQDIAGNDAATLNSISVTNSSLIPPAPIILGAQDDVGTTGNLYSNSSTDDSTPTLFGTAEANSVVTIYVDGVAVGTTNVDGTGHWSYTPNLSIATHTITATTKDTSGNVSAKSQDFNLSVFAPNPIENPTTALKAGTLLGLIGLDALGLIKLDNQPILAYDVNNDLKKVTVTNQALIGLSATIKYSQSVADILGLTITYNETGLIVLGMTAKLTITAKDGGTISNEVMTEFLASVYIPSLLNISVLPTLGIEAWDSRYTTDGNKDTNNQIIGYSKTSATSLLDVQLLGSTKVDVYDETTGLDHHASTTSVRIYGSTGNDTIIGGSANDILRGGDGNDSLNGGAGNDLLEGGKGNDILIGGTGSDTAVYRLLLSTDATGGNGKDTWTDFHKGNVATDPEADKIDIRDLLDSSVNMSNIQQYVFTTYDSVNNQTVIKIDRDGSGTTYAQTDLLILEHVNTTLDELLHNQQLIF
ncbi:SwmB domain-containing protein, partial [Acinetobacter guillouiae]